MLETWLCFHYPCFNEELQVVCAGIFSAHQSHMAYFLNEKVASLMWRMASRLKGIQLSKKEIPVVWAVTLLNPGNCFLIPLECIIFMLNLTGSTDHTWAV